VSAGRRLSLGLLAALFLGAGITHFTAPGFYVPMVPSWLPAPWTLVYASGVCEIVLGALVLVPAVRRLAAWGLVALLIAVFPANVNMAVNEIGFSDAPAWLPQPTPLGLWLRLPLQGVLAWWAWTFTRPEPAPRTVRAGAPSIR
jgi:uncharacterized membrane protein